jgi:hypothetical protein
MGTRAAAVGARHLRLAEPSQPSGLDCGSCWRPGTPGASRAVSVLFGFLMDPGGVSRSTRWHGSILGVSSNVARKGFERTLLGGFGPSTGGMILLYVVVSGWLLGEGKHFVPVRFEGSTEDVVACQACAFFGLAFGSLASF